LPSVSSVTLDFMDRLLTFDPTKRISVKAAMEHE
jgi:hypothetical protein